MYEVTLAMRALWFGVVLLSSAVVGCGPKEKSVVIRVVAYRFPAAHDASVISESEGTLGAFAHVHPPEEPFDLRFSYRHYQPNAQGADVPTLHWVNDANAEARILKQDGVIVICSVSHPLAHYTCGVQVIDAGLRWAAVFDRDQVANAAAIHAKAAAYLRGYREAASSERDDR